MRHVGRPPPPGGLRVGSPAPGPAGPGPPGGPVPAGGRHSHSDKPGLQPGPGCSPAAASPTQKPGLSGRADVPGHVVTVLDLKSGRGSLSDRRAVTVTARCHWLAGRHCCPRPSAARKSRTGTLSEAGRTPSIS